MVAEDSRDNRIKQAETVIEEWVPDFNRDFELKDKEDFVTIRCPQPFMVWVRNASEETSRAFLSLLVDPGEKITEDLLDSYSVPENVKSKVMQTIRTRNTKQAVEFGDSQTRPLVEIRLLTYLITSFTQKMQQLDELKEHGNNVKSETSNAASRFIILSDLLNLGKYKLKASDIKNIP